MGKIVFLIILTIVQFIKFTMSDDLVVPVDVQPQKKKNININLEVNLGIGGNCTAADIVRGNCTNYPNGTTLEPMFLTPLKPRTTQKRKFEKIGEYIKMNLCSYEFDDGRSCHVLCTMLGYVRYACSDLTLCHCWNKPGQTSLTMIVPTKKAGQGLTSIRTQTVGTTQTSLPTQGVLVWVHQCREGNDCAGYCSLKKYNHHECTDDETCHCYDPTPLESGTDGTNGPEKCTVFDGEDSRCLDHCRGKDFDSSRCLKDGSCECYNISQGSEAEDGRQEIPQTPRNTEKHIHVQDCKNGNLDQCEELCHVLKFKLFECSGKDTCHCFNSTVRDSKLTKPSIDLLLTGEYVKLDCTWKNNGIDCKKLCVEKEYEIFECVREDTCHCYDEPSDGNIGTGQKIVPGNRMLAANSSLSGNSLTAKSPTMAAHENRKNTANPREPAIPQKMENQKPTTLDETAQSDDGNTRRATNSSENTTTHSTRTTARTVPLNNDTPTPTNYIKGKSTLIATVEVKPTSVPNLWSKIRNFTIRV